MSKSLSHQEQHVLQDNFDLFGETTDKDKAQQKATKIKSPTTAKPPHRTPQKQNAGATAKQPENTTKRRPQKRTQANKKTPEKKHVPQTTDCAPALDQLHPNDKGISYLAIRASSADAGIKQLKELGVGIDNYAMDKREITLKNVADALLDRGLKYRIDQQTIHWVLSDSEIDTQTLKQQDWIELSINKAWFDAQKFRIRRLKGIAYLEACAMIAQQIALKNQTES
ncbi:MAG: hypothetical protein CL693_08635 [Cellvibrionaceae bacterium]|nr:hypothetical protein [Cellvibrionaceae bacterium]|tara:strand:+ start:33351 stop:34028 length:678 start_codon:yes stop_codon:yes gene_type:complete